MPDRISHYRIVRKLGEGGMGLVYAAEDERLGRSVALKLIQRTHRNDQARQRFWREARAAARVSHPNICHIYEVGEHEGELFLAMEFLQGESLAATIARSRLPVSEALRMMLQILEALQAIHACGLVHRDVKPSNIFVTPTGPKILDFGLARSDVADTDVTQTALTLSGVLPGTPQYMAPERLKGAPADARADIFAAGAVLFEMLAGKPAFRGATVMELLHAVLHERPAVLGGSEAIAAADRIVHRALSGKPDDRYPTARAMADDVRHALQITDSGETVRARSMSRLIVLPFRVLRGDPETDFLSFSLADAVTSSLSGLESLIVRSSVTASRYSAETPDLDALARHADVDIVLTGTLLRSGSQVRVTAQLVEAPGGAVIWSITSQVELGDIFSLQDTLTQRIVDSLSVPLSARDKVMLRSDVPATAKAYEFYLRANQLGYEPKNWSLARDLYLRCLEEDPAYAPAWARLGRIYRVLGMYSSTDPAGCYRQADAAFQRALALNPDLPLAHNLYTNLEVELGNALQAMLRLLKRAQTHAADAELFAGLVQACRYCGLLRASVVAYERARRLDPEIRTSVNHAYLMLGDYTRAIESNVEDPPTLNALSLWLMGRHADAISFLRKIEESTVTSAHRLFVVATRALLEGDHEVCADSTARLLDSWHPRDPCPLFYMARHLAFLGDARRALQVLEQAVEGGFYPYRFIARDPWLDGLRGESRFTGILRRAEVRYHEALEAFVQAGGNRALGLGKAVEALSL